MDLSQINFLLIFFFFCIASNFKLYLHQNFKTVLTPAWFLYLCLLHYSRIVKMSSHGKQECKEAAILIRIGFLSLSSKTG